MKNRADSVSRIMSEWQRERPDLDPDPIGIHGRVIRLSAHLLRQCDVWLNPLGLGWEAFSLIVTLRRAGKPYELRPTDILRESLLTSGAVTNRIDRVEKLGLVERVRAKGDRRSYKIRLSPLGKRLADKAIETHLLELKQSFGALSEADQQQLARLLGKLLSAAEGVNEDSDHKRHSLTTRRALQARRRNDSGKPEHESELVKVRK